MKNLVALVLIVSLAALASSAWAQNSGHYPLGSEGLKAATLPPPGLYLRTYTQYYTAEVLRDSSGDNSGLGFDTEVLAVAPRLIWMTDMKILGADYGMDVIVPYVYQDVEIDVYGLMQMKDNDDCVGDIYFAPVDLAWHGERYDIGAAFGIWFPTGKYDQNRIASPGKDFYTYMFTLGGTYYLNEEKTLHASILGRYEINDDMDHIDLRRGQDILFEWGVGATIAKVWDVGVVGYNQWQISDDTGEAAGDKNLHDRVGAVGPEVSVFVPPIKTFFSLRGLWEYGAVDRAEGATAVLTVTHIF